ncbi:hypothetical protein Daus18300_005584 [Diaporthe australafricana]|uniref:Cytochrome P450 n=1 Tax=Diaporthe australafricana TaxID=127596 RepID=A0ABR3X0E8_9PEZI
MWTDTHSLVVVAGCSALILYSLYCRLLPKPIPGIPYNKNATKTIMGDLPSLGEALDNDLTIWRWVTDQVRLLKSPIIQVWLKPFGNPIVVVADYREAADAKLRRTKEFDRANSLEHIFGPVLPEFHMLVKSANPTFKKHRRWLQDLMTTTFLHEVATEPIHKNVLELVALWDRKLELAQGHPFEAFQDVYYTALDAVMTFTLGGDTPHMALPAPLESVKSLDHIKYPRTPEEPAEFPEENRNEFVSSILTIAESVEHARVSAAPGLLSWYMHKTPAMRKALKVRDAFIDHAIDQSVQKLRTQEPIESAVDHMIYREQLFAKKEDRAPIYNSGGTHSEIFGFLMAGHETSATTFSWGLKFLSDHPVVQKTLREELRERLSAATEEGRQPTHDEIVKTSIPYLEATMEEILRLAGTVSVSDREAICDTSLLGHQIPKGTNVIFSHIGPSMLEPAFDIPESLRSEKGIQADRQRTWENSAYPHAEFRPERWLVPSDEKPGEVVFDSAAGPQLAFGLGVRACFGRRLAYLELRLLTAILFWNYEFLPCAPEYSSYKGLVGFTVKPRQCFVRISKVVNE